MPRQLQENIEAQKLEIIEAELPKPSKNEGSFKYYNSLRCPHCLAPFIDFAKHKEIRPNEYYGNTYINETPTYWKD